MRNALLLLGPTGVGKTPLGDALERDGLAGQRCHHFDFGAQLRAVNAGHARPEGLTDADRAFVRKVLTTGALLENETFYIAERILRGFMARRCRGEHDLIVMNGLPRHVDQARDVDRLVDIRTVVQLACSPDVAAARIRLNSGGDRTGRTDDALPAIERKIALFQSRTLPLLDHYKSRGVYMAIVSVGVSTTPRDVVRHLEREYPLEGDS